jgi:glucose-6-phosphate 1-dehydrogenase
MPKPDNQILVIFGASGNLTQKKLIPALYHLFKQDLLPQKFAILGVGRKSYSDKDFRIKVQSSLLSYSPDSLKGSTTDTSIFAKNIFYNDLETTNPESYVVLRERIEKLASHYGGNCIYYLATPPSMYGIIAESLAKTGMNSEDTGWKRIIIEKPFGYDLASSRDLTSKLNGFFDERQIFRIDHYLGKETVQNIMVSRFSNGIFEPIWNRNYISHIEITAAEQIGVEDRGGYYDGSGALRDMFQNHILQLVALVAMEPPVLADSNSIRNEIVKVLESLRPLSQDNIRKDVIRAQYMDSNVRGKKILSYRSEHGINPDSRTETYIALKFFIDNWRWKDVPFYVRSGKSLPTRVTEIVIHFQATPHHIFSINDENILHSQLIIRIQPDEGILLKFGMKVPGAGYKVQSVNMDFHYSDLADTILPTAYERLLLDSMLGDSTLYARSDVVDCAWRFTDPILKFWEDHPDHSLYGYPSGTWGPPEADALFDEAGNSWRFPCKNLTNDDNYCEL